MLRRSVAPVWRQVIASRARSAPQLTPERIAATALALIDEKGAAGFTTRSIAEVLGVTPMALYHHVENKRDLAVLVVEQALAERPLEPVSGDWREDLWALANWMRLTTLAHPAVMHIRQAHRVWVPSMVQLAERWVSSWRESGLELEAAVRAARSSGRAIVGLVDGEVVARDIVQPDATLVAAMPNARRLLVPQDDVAAMFELAVRALIDGLHARLLAASA